MTGSFLTITDGYAVALLILAYSTGYFIAMHCNRKCPYERNACPIEKELDQ